METRKGAIKPSFSFCLTNLDMYSGVVEQKLRYKGFKTIEFHCLGLCADCMNGSVAIKDENEIVNPEEWLCSE
ncbi:DUF1450 domain-containing protein [Paraliobacillus salinarum]|uniref:DUF1450 domain-containing protein n=1 Tax=Paraliobacillus salinarum TaxID=1158996 RepID=UPI0015F60E0D|nr:DUF1450 domain-containing protein [Paraliobacillus salinarum]